MFKTFVSDTIGCVSFVTFLQFLHKLIFSHLFSQVFCFWGLNSYFCLENLSFFREIIFGNFQNCYQHFLTIFQISSDIQICSTKSLVVSNVVGNYQKSRSQNQICRPSFLVVSVDLSRKRIKRQKFPCLKRRKFVSFQVPAFLIFLSSFKISKRCTWI